MCVSNFKEYFNSLTDIEKKFSPKELFFQGDFNLLTEGIRVSVVGSRNASKNGLLRAEVITKELVKRNITVVSGLALGIDSIAHRAAIENGGKTIAVLGTPLDVSYPKVNAPLLDSIKKDHLAISQFPDGYPMMRKNFPMRNKTMALISDATIIVEATEKSGTQHQAWEALRLGRDLLIMENLFNDSNLKWPLKMLDYGAQVLNRDNFSNLFNEIHHLTSKTDHAF